MDTDEILGGRIGEALVGQGDMTQEQVDKVLQAQKSGDDRLFGEIAVDMGFIDLDVVIRYLESEDID